MQATWRGRWLLALFDAAMGLIRQGLRDCGSFDPGTSTAQIVVLVSKMAELALLPSLPQALAARATGLRLSVRQLSRTEHAVVFEAGLADLAIGFIAAPRHSLRVRRLLQDRFVCVMRAGHPAKRKPSR